MRLRAKSKARRLTEGPGCPSFRAALTRNSSQKQRKEVFICKREGLDILLLIDQRYHPNERKPPDEGYLSVSSTPGSAQSMRSSHDREI